eukprot:scaffold199225_cov39-Tisochrysis_lutea.AAC.1
MPMMLCVLDGLQTSRSTASWFSIIRKAASPRREASWAPAAPEACGTDGNSCASFHHASLPDMSACSTGSRRPSNWYSGLVGLKKSSIGATRSK